MTDLSGRLGIVDWDHLCLGAPLFDLAYCADPAGSQAMLAFPIAIISLNGQPVALFYGRAGRSPTPLLAALGPHSREPAREVAGARRRRPAGGVGAERAAAARGLLRRGAPPGRGASLSF